MHTTKLGYTVGGGNGENNLLQFITLEDCKSLDEQGRQEFYRLLCYAINCLVTTTAKTDCERGSYYSMPTNNPIYELMTDKVLEEVFDWRDQMILFCNRTEELKDITKGREFYKQARRLGVSGRYEMTLGTLKGYNLEYGSWNGFDCEKVNKSLDKVHALLPRVMFAQNNPNNGRVKHKWISNKDYIRVEFDYIDQKMLDGIKKVLDEIESVMKSVEFGNADNVRIEIEEIKSEGISKDDPRYYAELVFWWD